MTLPPLTITPTTLCYCLHINASHDGEQACRGIGCTCQRFSPGSRTSAHHYRRGQVTKTKRVARLEPGDIVLVGYPGYDEYVRGADGGIVWEQGPDDLIAHPLLRHYDDYVLRPMQRKSGALLAWVTGTHTVPGRVGSGEGARAPSVMHVIETDLGELAPLFGVNTVMVLTGKGAR